MDLTTDFHRAQTAYADRLAYALAHRQAERWSKGPLLHAEPFDFERLGLAPGKWLPKKPAATPHTYCYWLDEEAGLLAVRKGLALPNQFYEEFFFTEQGLAKSCLYNNMGRVENVKTRVRQAGRLREVFLLGRRGSKHETYYYEGNVLVRLHVDQWNAEQVGPSYQLLFSYHDDHLHKIKQVFDTGYEQVCYPAKR
jgi:hypothetical protein